MSEERLDTRNAELAEAAARHARRVKEQHVRRVKGKPGRTDIQTIVEGFRDGEPAVVMFAPPHRDLMLGLAELMGRGFAANTLALTFETFTTAGAEASQENPDTGQSWGPDEMAEYFERHGAGGSVAEALMTSVYNRAGDVVVQVQPYMIEGNRVRWERPNELGVPGVGGLVHDRLTAIMEETDTLTKAFKALPDFAALDHDDALVHLDMGMLSVLPKLLSGIPDVEGRDVAVLLFATPGSKRHQLLRERLGRGSVVDPAQWN